MKKILALSLVAIGLIAADVPLKINGKVVMERHPLPFNVLSQESGGPLSAIDAYSDGIGVLLVNSPTGGIQIDNSGLNSLVYKHGEAAKALGAPLKDYVLTNISDPVDVAIAEKLNDAFAEGGACDDGNLYTFNDTYTNGVCQGIYGIVGNDTVGRTFADGTIAKSCKEYINKVGYVYQGDVGNGLYKITNGITYNAYCDMTTDGGGWTMVVAQFENDPVTNWNEGIQADYDPTLSSSKGFALNSNQLPPHTQTAFGKHLDPTATGYSNFVYSTGNINKTLLFNLKTGQSHHIHRSTTRFYFSHDPEDTLTTLNIWNNTLTYDLINVAGHDWSFSPLNDKGYALNGYTGNISNSFAWTVWVR